MDPQVKRRLLLRKFSSSEYMEECQSYFRNTLDALDEALAYFEKQYSQDDWKNWHSSEWPTTWRDRAQKNMENLYVSLKQGIQQYQSGDPDRLRGTCNGLTALSKDMEGMGEKWWSYILAEYQERFDKNLAAAIKRGSNIWRTVGDYWKTPDSVLKETITGPIDEQDLLRY